jgi:hypothetical protein
MVVVVFENLTVCGMGGVKHLVKTFPDAFIDFFNLYGTVRSFMGTKFGTETEILHDFNGIVKPREVYFIQISANPRCCLCWDKPIAAAQRVLELTLVNQRTGYTRIDGDVAYGGTDSSTFAKYFRGEAVYNQDSRR